MSIEEQYRKLLKEAAKHDKDYAYMQMEVETNDFLKENYPELEEDDF
ncbi:hypothetical protein LCGC14_0531280 [marine sediment metagenome]|uniref:Uncharacterized protein n=1 Tax=marine sediment metagenome TaxID=412755 RepID=A0A0F9SDV8_9ZZZZ